MDDVLLLHAGIVDRRIQPGTWRGLMGALIVARRRGLAWDFSFRVQWTST
jgi:hypothetical protein